MHFISVVSIKVKSDENHKQEKIQSKTGITTAYIIQVMNGKSISFPGHYQRIF
jgi:hypothetical protein